MTILLHSSKTMVTTPPSQGLSEPRFESHAQEIATYISGLPIAEIARVMHISEKLALNVQAIYQTREQEPKSAAVEVFRGDIYSGLRALEWTAAERSFAQKHLVILSGLYGLLRPFDGIQPYRLEAAYKFPDHTYRDMYRFWGDRLIKALPSEGPIINTTSAEYAKLLLPFFAERRLITPSFLTQTPGKPEPVFVTVHTKIARGAFARWLIQRGVDSADDLQEFSDLGYQYDPERSLPDQPVYICTNFQGIGLSQRLL